MMIEDEVESCASRAVQSQKAHPRHHSQKLEAYNEVLRRIREFNHEEANIPDFDDQLWLHFNRLPARYAFDVNVERAEDVLAHMRLLKLAEDPANRPALQVRLVQVQPFGSASYGNSMHSDPSENEDAQSSFEQEKRIHLPPTFGSSSNLEALSLKRSKNNIEDEDGAMDVIPYPFQPMHEITFSTVDKLKVLSQLTALLGEIGLNIQEAHAFSTNDGFSLDVFVVEGWPNEDTEELKAVLEKEILKFKNENLFKIRLDDKIVEQYLSKQGTHYAADDHDQERMERLPRCIEIPSDGTDVWEINTNLLKFEDKVGSGSFGDLYKGTYCSQVVAIKVLKPELTNTDMLREFAQEVYIMRKIRHRNVVQFIGACTRPPNPCIVTEFMSRGSLYDFLHKQRGVFKLPSLLKVAIDVSKGMNYLHQNNIIHRDLKTANLLMDENEVVKVADFGVARVKIQSGVMTAETGTYRWMAPEIIEHKPYDQKADVFSFGITLWELLTRELPYSYLTPLQAAVGVVQKGLRPTIPKSTHPRLSELLQRCWQQDPKDRPEFSEIIEILQLIAKEVVDEKANNHKDKSPHGFLSTFKWGHH